MKKLHVIVATYEQYEYLEILIKCFIIQTNPNWVLHVVYDGPVPRGVWDIINPFLIKGKRYDERVHFYETPERLQQYGHPNRKAFLQSIKTDPDDFILITNGDNYYVPIFVEEFLAQCTTNTGFVFCDTLHSYMRYAVLKTILAENHIDLGSFIVRADVAKTVGFNHMHLSADGRYAVECANYCRAKKLRVVQIGKPLFVHN